MELPVNELIRSFRLERAGQLLAQNWGPVSQVAYEVGFSIHPILVNALRKNLACYLQNIPLRSRCINVFSTFSTGYNLYRAAIST